MNKRAQWLGWGIFAGSALPVLFLGLAVTTANFENTWRFAGSRSFWIALTNSSKVAAGVLLLAFAIGWPAGTALALSRRWWSAVLVPLGLVTLLMPPFLWAIGWQSLRAYFSYAHQVWLDRLPGTILSHGSQVLAITMTAAYASVHALHRNMIESAILDGGDGLVYRMALRWSAPSALGGAMLGTTITLSDSGCGQIMGHHGLAGEVLVAFAGKINPAEAGAKAFAMAVVLAPLAIVGSITLARSLFYRLAFRRAESASKALSRGRMSWLAPGCCLLAAGMFILPIWGIIRPLCGAGGWGFVRHAAGLFGEMAGTTLLSALSISALATLGALVVSLSTGSGILLISTCLILFSIPSSIFALGWIAGVSHAPPGVTAILRTEWMSWVMMALRFVPAAICIILPVLWRMDATAWDAARLSAMPVSSRFIHVGMPQIRVTLVNALVILGFFGASDVSALVLLQPPGTETFLMHLFAVMDNSSERAVSSLALVALGCGFLGASMLILVNSLLGRHIWNSARAG